MAYAIKQDNYRSKRSYISTQAFNGSIYSYVSALNTTNFKQEGKLVAITTSPAGVTLSATNCPAGRVLRENGRKLYPNANPGLLSGDTYQGVANFQGATEAANHFWVGVFDAVTGVKGFINPNAATFAIYNSDKPVDLVDVYETNGTGVNKDLAIGGRLLLSNTVIGTANPLVAGSAIMGQATLASGTVTVNTTAVKANSIIFLTRATVSGTANNIGGALGSSISAGTSFTINSHNGTTAVYTADTSTVNWLIVNSS